MSRKTCKNYYNILGVTPDSEAEEVKSAYRKLARELHPDVNKNPESVQKFKDVIEAYQTLSNEKKRNEYNMINGFYKTPNPHKYDSFDNIREQPQSDIFEKQAKEEKATVKEQKKETTFEKENLSENVRKSNFRASLNSILNDISKNHNFKQKPLKSKNGQDIRTELEIDLKEAKTGAQRVLNIMHREICPHCKGHRFINGTKCKTCAGSGEFELKRRIIVKIPSGVKNNSVLRLKGEGNPGFFGGTNGNLYITVKIKEPANITVEGNNILYKLFISPYDAVLGGDIEIKDFSQKIKLTIPPMTKSGQKFRLANQGMQTNGKFGDMIVTVEIQLPDKLSTEEVSLYGKLKKLANSLTRE